MTCCILPVFNFWRLFASLCWCECMFAPVNFWQQRSFSSNISNFSFHLTLHPINIRGPLAASCLRGLCFLPVSIISFPQFLSTDCWSFSIVRLSNDSSCSYFQMITRQVKKMLSQLLSFCITLTKPIFKIPLFILFFLNFIFFIFILFYLLIILLFLFLFFFIPKIKNKNKQKTTSLLISLLISCWFEMVILVEEIESIKKWYCSGWCEGIFSITMTGKMECTIKLLMSGKCWALQSRCFGFCCFP